MKIKGVHLIFIFFFFLLLLTLGVYLFSTLYPCFILRFSEVPINNNDRNDKRTIVFLYGNLCAACSSGEYLYSLRKEKEFIFVVPSQFNFYDIENLRNTYSLEGIIIKGNNKIDHYVERLLKCSNSKTKNFIVKTRNKKLVDFRQF